MSNRIYYVLCEDNCRFESMTKEQIYAAIAEATGNVPTGIDDAFITKIQEGNASADIQFWVGTEAQFNALSPLPTWNTFQLRRDTAGKWYAITDIYSREKTLYGTLTAGQTTLVISDASITTNDTIDVYTSNYRAVPINVVATNGAITLTFTAQQSDVNVKVRIS